MKAVVIILAVWIILVAISAVIFAIGEYRKMNKTKTKYLCYCKQPESALRNRCDYYGSFNNKCLCPYDGCNLQGIKDKTEEAG
ncbi:MAG: hypothetical protein UGF89_01880 [Acutalibacteraceae bacterium]|nr:hypothetical protein [Acutalibacteraceae bacterium]